MDILGIGKKIVAKANNLVKYILGEDDSDSSSQTSPGNSDSPFGDPDSTNTASSRSSGQPSKASQNTRSTARTPAKDSTVDVSMKDCHDVSNGAANMHRDTEVNQGVNIDPVGAAEQAISDADPNTETLQEPTKDTIIEGEVANHEIAIEEDLTDFDIKEGVLKGYNGTKRKVTIPRCVKCIGDGAFYYNTLIKSVFIHEEVLRIGNEAFGFCENLAEVVVHGDDIAICSDAFSDCPKLTNIIKK